MRRFRWNRPAASTRRKHWGGHAREPQLNDIAGHERPQRLLALDEALDRLGATNNLSHCVTEAVAEGGDSAAEKVREASDAIARLVHS